jgi:hypothetical protein
MTKFNYTPQLVRATLLASAVLAIPMIALAHGGVDDGHIEEVIVDTGTHSAGASELIKAWTPRWWGLLLTSTLLTSALSYGVWKYLQVVPPKKAGSPEEKK